MDCPVTLEQGCNSLHGNATDDVNYDETYWKELMRVTSPRLHAVSGILGIVYYYVLYTQHCFYDLHVSSFAFYF